MAKVEEVDEGAKDEEGEDQNNQEEGKKYLRKTHTPSHLEMTTTNEQPLCESLIRVIDECKEEPYAFASERAFLPRQLQLLRSSSPKTL